MRNFKFIRLLAKELANNTKGFKHKFNENWIDKLIDFYKRSNGKNIIHLLDVDDNLFLKLNDKGKKILRKLLISKLNVNKNSIRSVKRCLESDNKFVSLKNLKNFFGKEINSIESTIKEIKTTKSGRGKSVKNPKFPINLNTKFGAILLGSYPDAAIKRGEFGSKDIEFLNDLEKYFKRCIGEVKPLIWYSGSIFSMQLSSIVKILYKLSGLKTNNTQIMTNNGIPYWVFNSSKNFQQLLLRKLWDAEGSAPVDKKMCLGQSVVLNQVLNDIPLYPERKSFAEVESKNKRKVLNHPPNLLVSIQLFLFKFGIISFIKPHRLYKKKNGLVVCDWHLLMFGYQNIKKFYNQIGFGLKRKQLKLKDCVESYIRMPEPIEKRESELLNLMKKFTFFTINDIELCGKLAKGTLRNYLTKMRKEGKIEKVRNLPQAHSSFLHQYKVNSIRRGMVLNPATLFKKVKLW